jgi:hypothetical protein
LVVCQHQPNFLPGLSIVEKVAAADAVIWMDAVEYTGGGWTNRNRMPDGSWLTVPVAHGSGEHVAIRDIGIAEHGGWRRKAEATIRNQYRGAALDQVCAEIQRPYRLLVGLNLALLRIVLAGSQTAWHFQSHLHGGRALRSDELTTETPGLLRGASERLAAMTEEIGGTVYLSGRSGRGYLDETPFHRRGIEVTYFDWPLPNRCSLERIATARPSAEKRAA